MTRGPDRTALARLLEAAADVLPGGVHVVVRGAADARGAAAGTEVRRVREDSREVGPGDLFVARRGAAADGHDRAADAIARGATAVLAEAPARIEAPAGVAVLGLAGPGTDDPGRRARLVARAAARLAERAAGDPSRALDLVGVTGTNGKTTTAHLVARLLSPGNAGVDAGPRCGFIGTTGIDDGVERSEARWTTPPACALSGLLEGMRARGTTACAMEVSSHALDQGRVAGVRFAAAVFTNLTGDHLDYHGTMEAYAAAKRRLLRAVDAGAPVIVPADDPWTAFMVDGAAGRVLRTRVVEEAPAAPVPGDADAVAAARGADASGIDARLEGPWGAIDVRLPLVGRHNLANALQAACVAHALGVGRDDLAARLAATTAPPGRLEPVAPSAAEGLPAVFVDYAHTDDAVASVLASVRPIVPAGGRLVALVGAGGDRDRTKRPRMAAAACAGADVVHLTSDNPRTEDPERILDDLASGVPSADRDRVRRDADRARAIDAALRAAGPHDVVVIAGKGHETVQIVGTERRAFDDRLVARAVLERLAADGRATGVLVETTPRPAPAPERTR